MKKIIYVFVTVISLLFFVSCSVNDELKNDREYLITELVGTYNAERNNNGTTYEYKLVINSNSTAELNEESYTFESLRMGITWKKNLASSTIRLTESDISISNYKGYIRENTIILKISDYDVVFSK